MDDLDAIPTEKKARRFTFLLVGVVLGVIGTVFVPSLVRPYLPAALRGSDTEIQGSVFKKQLEAGEKPRLLLSVDTEQGAVLATFTRKVAEIDMLVDEGDQVSLGVDAYEPFISDPTVSGVRKGSGQEPDDWVEDATQPEPATESEAIRPADSVSATSPEVDSMAAPPTDAIAEVDTTVADG